jgi:DNA (cytosine-5)-methyltransferase 3A
MNVLSLFDGMSCGQIALKNLGVKVSKYYASEIDPHAVKVSSANFPSMVHLGDVSKIDLSILPKIDLLIGGSPCTGFSFAGKQLNFKDPQSKLFFDYVRIWKEVNPKWFLLENVVMKKEFEDVITDYMGVKPVKINSDIFSAQNRNRLYWTNIPIAQIVPQNVTLKDVLPEGDILVHNIYGGFKEDKCRVFENKSPTLRANSGGGSIPSVFRGSREEAQNLPLSELRKRIRKLTVEECKKLQTIPEDILMDVSYTQSLKMIGNGWTVKVIEHIFKGMFEKVNLEHLYQ